MAARELLRRNSLILAGYLLIALLVIGQNPLRLVDHFIGSDTGDTTEMARNVWYFSYALRNGIPLFDQTLLGYPDGIDGSVLMTVPLQYLPMTLLALFLPLTLAYNLIVILWMGLNGWSMYWLVYDRIRQPVPALFAGLIYLAFPLFQGHLAEGHAGLLVAWAAPLYVWALLRLSESPRWQLRWSLAVGVFFYLTTTGHILQSIYVLLPVTGVFVLLQLWRRNWAAFWRVTIVAAFSALLVLLIVLPAIRSVSQETAYTSVESAVRYSSDLLAPFSPSFLHPLFDQLLAYPRSVLGTNQIGRAHV